MKTVLSLALVIAFVSTGASAQTPAFEFTAFNYPGATGNTVATGINDAGQIVGTVAPEFRVQKGFLKDGSFFDIEVPVGGVLALRTKANGINNLGDIVGSYLGTDADTGLHGFVRSGGAYSTIDVPGANHTEAFGINDVGDIVGRYSMGLYDEFHGFLFREGRFTTIEVPPDQGTATMLFGINNRGQIVGSYGTGDYYGYRVFLYDNGQFTYIPTPTPDARYVIAGGINDLGEIVGTYFDEADNLQHGFRYAFGRFVRIDVPASFVFQVLHGQEVLGINGLGQIVGEYSDNLGPHALVGTPLARITGLTATPAALWPPNHKLTPVTINVETSEPASCSITGVASTEPVNRRNADWIVVAPLALELRADHDNVYTVTVTCVGVSSTMEGDLTIAVEKQHRR